MCWVSPPSCWRSTAPCPAPVARAMAEGVRALTGTRPVPVRHGSGRPGRTMTGAPPWELCYTALTAPESVPGSAA